MYICICRCTAVCVCVCVFFFLCTNIHINAHIHSHMYMYSCVINTRVHRCTYARIMIRKCIHVWTLARQKCDTSFEFQISTLKVTFTYYTHTYTHTNVKGTDTCFKLRLEHIIPCTWYIYTSTEDKKRLFLWSFLALTVTSTAFDSSLLPHFSFRDNTQISERGTRVVMATVSMKAS